MRSRLRFLFFLLCLLLIAPVVDSKRWETGFLDRTIVVQGTTYKYQVYVPEDWSPRKKWPIILFLHGAGERANDGLLQTQVGIGEAIREHRDRIPAIVVMPQCPKDSWWAQSTMDEAAMGGLRNVAPPNTQGDSEQSFPFAAEFLRLMRHGGCPLAT